MVYSVCACSNIILGMPQVPMRLTFEVVADDICEQTLLMPAASLLNNRWVICREDYDAIKEGLSDVAEQYVMGESFGTPGVRTQSLPHIELKEYNNIFSMAVFKYEATLENLAHWLFSYAAQRLFATHEPARPVIAKVTSTDARAAVYPMP